MGGKTLPVLVGLAIIFAVGMWRLADGGEASVGAIIVGVVATIVAFVGFTLWDRRTGDR